MKENTRQPLFEILKITRMMHEKACRGEWERVQDLEAEQRALIGGCFPLDDTTADPKQTRNQIAEIISLHRRIITAASAARQEQAGALGRLRQGRQATRVYRDVGA